MTASPRTCLVVVFNHRYDANIPKLRRLYRERFPLMRFLVPFYDGDDPDVVPVYASSEVFQGYFAQAHAALAPLGAAHYLFMGDDVLLNPTVNAENLAERLGLGPETGFFPVLKSLCEADARWSPIFYPFKAFAPTPFVTVGDALPSRTEAEARFAAHGLAVQPLRWGQLLRLHRLTPKYVGAYLRAAWPVAGRLLRDRALPYPMAYGFSDVCVVPGAHLAEFCRYCGVFAALGLMVELALPTALALACPHVVGLDARGWSYHAVWGEALAAQYDGNLTALLAEFGARRLFIHPIKLSRWHLEESV